MQSLSKKKHLPGLASPFLWGCEMIQRLKQRASAFSLKGSTGRLLSGTSTFPASLLLPSEAIAKSEQGHLDPGSTTAHLLTELASKWLRGGDRARRADMAGKEDLCPAEQGRRLSTARS